MDSYKDTAQLCSAAEMAAKWGISRRRVQIFCAEGRIEGAVKIGSTWIIPSNVRKPEDPRRRRR